MIVYLARHGHVENPANVFYGPEPELSSIGRTQIQRAAEELRHSNPVPTKIICSPWIRTRESAEIYAKHLRLSEIETDDRLTDWDPGPWRGKRLEVFYADTGYGDDPPNLDLPSEIEPLEHAAMRVQQAIWEAMDRNPQETILVIGHREPIVAAMLQWQKRSFQEIHRIEFPVSAIWRMELTDQGDCIEAVAVVMPE